MSSPTANGFIREALAAFGYGTRATGVETLPGGHIHADFLVTTTSGRLVLQRLNTYVFADINALLSNVERVVNHLRVRRWPTPRLVETSQGAYSYRSADGSTWRAFHYLEGTEGRTEARGPTDAYVAARTLAGYVTALTDLPPPRLIETIPSFHDLRARLARLDEVIASDPVGRRPAVAREIDRCRRFGREIDQTLTKTGDRVVRTVHNDAKLSNVRFATGSGRASFVIDMDTTMDGHLRFDVGELIRTAGTRAVEDSTDEDAVDLDLESVAAVASGFLATCPALEPAEIEALALAGPEMAIENAVRFLTDHLAGDHYFAIDRVGHNLDRCRTQLRLAELLLAAYAEIDACFRQAAGAGSNR